jgi:hypothetical protein
MALIECYECGKEISSLAPHCIHCGAPIKITKKKKATKRKASSDELTDRQREQLKRIESTTPKTSTKKKTAKKRAAKTQHPDDIGEHKSSYRRPANWLSGSESSPKKTVKKKKAIKRKASSVELTERQSEQLIHGIDRNWEEELESYASTIQWKAVISQTAIIWIVSIILGFLVSWVIKSLMALAVINVIVLVTGFTLIHYFTEENRLQHCIHVAVACWLTSIINVVFGVPFISWLLGVFVIPVLMIIGMSISYLIRLSKNN